MESKEKQLSVLNQFFGDVNVKFPQKPKIVSGIHIYEAPRGLGIQFRGGTEKFLIKGLDSYAIWNYLKNLLDGKHMLKDIIDDAMKVGIDVINMGNFLKTLHSYHLLEPDALITEEDRKDMHFDIFSIKQIQYYNRIVPRSGLNKRGQDVLERIRNCKILLITNEIFAPVVSYQLLLAGFRDIGFLVVASDDSECAKDYVNDDINIMTYTYISSANNIEVRNILSSKLSDYQYVLTVLSNPNLHFESEVSRMCTRFNRPMLPISVKENSYEVGPFYFPEMESPCISCYNLREQSYRKDAVYEYIYQESLRSNEKITDNQIKGFDYNSLAIMVNMATCQLKNAVAKVSQPKLIGSVFKFNSLNYIMSMDNVIKVPGCPSCSGVNKQ